MHVQKVPIYYYKPLNKYSSCDTISVSFSFPYLNFNKCAFWQWPKRKWDQMRKWKMTEHDFLKGESAHMHNIKHTYCYFIYCFWGISILPVFSWRQATECLNCRNDKLLLCVFDFLCWYLFGHWKQRQILDC